MKKLFLQLITFPTLFALIASTQLPVQHFFLENELVLDPASRSSDEWIVSTEPNHIFYFSFLTNEHDDDEQILTSLTIVDVNNSDSLLFPSEDNKLSPFYSTSNAVSIKFKETSLHLNSFRLKIEKAVSCPFNIGGSTSCGRVVDELSCYCGLFAARTWEDTKAYCKSYNMNFLSVESYEEELGVFSAFGGFEVLWIGLSDTKSEGNFVWDSTGKNLSPGYMGWAPDRPLHSSSSCEGSLADCVAYNISNTLPAWVDLPCASNYSGICELQPTNSSRRSAQQVKLSLEKELIFDLSGPSDEWIISTDSNHIFYFSFVASESSVSIDEQQKEVQSSLSIMDVNHPENQLFPFNIDALSPFYSIGDTVSIKLMNKLHSSSMNGLQLKVEKAVPCPFNLGGASSCGRIVDDLSCYCATFAARSWTATRDFCKANNMSFVSIESYEEDLALFNAFGGVEDLWIGANDSASEGTFVWDSTGKKMSPGYQGWYSGQPISSCGTSTYGCVVIVSIFPAWYDNPCSLAYGGICELQPTGLF